MSALEQANLRINEALNPLQSMAAEAMRQGVDVIAYTPVGDDDPERMSKIPNLVIERVKTAKRAINSCLDEIIGCAQEKIKAALVEPTGQTKMAFRGTSAHN